MRPSVLLLVAMACAPGPAAAQTMAWDEIEYGHMDGPLRSGGLGHGEVGQLTLGLERVWYLAAASYGADSRDDESAPVSERVIGGRAGIGIHGTQPGAEEFLLLSYVREERRWRTSTGAQEDLVEGASVTIGVRWHLAPWLLFEPEASLASYGRDETRGFLRGHVLLRLARPLWLFGGFGSPVLSGDADTWSAGLRFTFSDPSRAAGTRPLGEDTELPATLQPGQHLVAARSLVLQQKALFGAAEIGTIPAGATLTLQKSETNDFGAWWYVLAGEKEGWIRESRLK